MRIYSFLCLSLFSILMISCQTNDVFNGMEKIPNAKWNNNHQVTFQTFIQDTLVPLDVYVQLRNNQYYPRLLLHLNI